VTLGFTVETDSTSPTDYTYAYSYAVDGEDSVSVGAGDYTALHIVESSTGSEQWVARDVGTVKTDYTELESYTR